jgi:hypothetical protein
MSDPVSLNVGDMVILLKIPDSVRVTAPNLRDGADGILRVYQRAMDKRSRLCVTFIDEYGRPWVEYSFKNKRDVFEHHAMLIDDDSYVVVPQDAG